MTEERETIQTRLRAFRVEVLGLTLNKFRNELLAHVREVGREDIPLATISSYEMSRFPKPYYLELCLRTFPDLNIDWLLVGRGEPRRSEGDRQRYFDSSWDMPYMSDMLRSRGSQAGGLYSALRTSGLPHPRAEEVIVLDAFVSTVTRNFPLGAAEASEEPEEPDDETDRFIVELVENVLAFPARHPEYFASHQEVSPQEWTTFVLGIINAMRPLARSIREDTAAAHRAKSEADDE